MAKRKYKAHRRKRAKSSYTSYKQWRRKLEKKGYSMLEVMSKEEFNEMYAGLKDAGKKNLAREIARGDRTFNAKKRRDILKSMDITVEEFQRLASGDSKEAREAREQMFKAVVENLYDGDYDAARDAWGY